MTFPAKQWSDQQVADLAQTCSRKLKLDYQLVFRVVDWMLGEGIGKTLKVLGSDGACHGTLSGYVTWGCRCDPCEEVAEKEQARMERQGRKAS